MYPINTTQMQRFSPLPHTNCHKNGERTLPQVSYTSCTHFYRTGLSLEHTMHNRPPKREILEDRQRTNGHFVQATRDAQLSDFHTYTKVCVCPEESVVTYKYNIRKKSSSIRYSPHKMIIYKGPADFIQTIFQPSSPIKSFQTQGDTSQTAGSSRACTPGTPARFLPIFFTKMKAFYEECP